MSSINWGSNLGPLTQERNNIILNGRTNKESRLEYMKINQKMDYEKKQKEMSSPLLNNSSFKIDSDLTKSFRNSNFTNSESLDNKGYLDLSSGYSQSRINKLRLSSDLENNSKS